MAIEDYCRVDAAGDLDDENNNGNENGSNNGGNEDADLGNERDNQRDNTQDVPAQPLPRPPTPRPPFPQPLNFDAPTVPYGRGRETGDPNDRMSDFLHESATSHLGLISSIQRKVTIVSDQSFITDQFDLEKIREHLEKTTGRSTLQGNPRVRKFPLRGTTWFRIGGGGEQREKPDYLRWALGAVWQYVSPENTHGLFGRMTISRQVIGPHNDVYNYDPILGRGDQITRQSILRFYGPVNTEQPGPLGLDTPSYQISPMEDSDGSTSPGVKEMIRFGLKLPGSESRRNNINPYTERADYDRFLRIYMPEFTDGTAAEKFGIFLKTLVLGDDMATNSNAWSRFLEMHSRGGSRFASDAPENRAGEVFSYRDGLLDRTPLGGYNDYVFDAPVAFFEDELDNILLSPFHSAKITGQFGNLEKMSERDYGSIYEIPNLYRFYNYLEMEKTYGKQMYASMNFAEQNAWNIASQYLENWRDPNVGPEDASVIDDSGSALSKRRYQDVVLKFPADRVEKFEKTNELIKKYAPNYVEISINTSQGGEITSFIQKNKMDRLLLETLRVSRSDTDIQAEKDVAEFIRDLGFSRTANDPGYYGSVSDSGNIEEKMTFVLDDFLQALDIETSRNVNQSFLDVTINDQVQSGVTQTIYPQFVDNLRYALPNASTKNLQYAFLGHYPLKFTGWNNVALLRLEDAIRSQIFLNQLDNYVLENNLTRTYADILNGKKAYSEVVGYRIDKHVYYPDGYITAPIQSIYLIDSNNIDNITYLDSQVYPYAKYRYKIYTINFVVGTHYNFLKEQTIIRRYNFDLAVNSRPKYYLIEAPFFEQDIEVRDHPPLAPQVSFLPYQGVEDKFGILLTVNYGEEKERRINIKAPDEIVPGPAENQMTTFRTDNLPNAFQWFRLEEPPETYSDFHKGLQNIVPANNKSTFIMQDVEPNKYYYYTFRSIDHYGSRMQISRPTMESNPTEVYRVRIVSYENGIFMEMEPYEMYKIPKDFKTEFEQVIKICPSFENTVYNFNETFNRISSTSEAQVPNNSIHRLRKEIGNQPDYFARNVYVADTKKFQETSPPIEEVAIGMKDREQDLVWQRKFKFRIRSKNSGKTIDLNVNFIKDKIVLEKE